MVVDKKHRLRRSMKIKIVEEDYIFQKNTKKKEKTISFVHVNQ